MMIRIVDTCHGVRVRPFANYLGMVRGEHRSSKVVLGVEPPPTELPISNQQFVFFCS